MASDSGAPSVDLLSYVFENILDDQGRPVLIDASNTSRFLTARNARSTVKKLIAGLRAEGFERGDCLCVHSFNDIYYPLIYLAVVGAGGIFTGSNPGYTSLELNHHVRTSHAKYLITEPHLLPTALETAHECNIPESRLFVFDSFDKEPYEHQRSWNDLLEHGEEEWIRFKCPEEKDTVAMLGFTSGTTGLPKAAMITHNYLVSQTWAIESRGKPYDVSRLLCLPTFHAFALPLMVTTPLRERHPMYLMRRFDIKQYLEAIELFAVTETALVPAMIYGILKSPLATKQRLKSLQYLWSAGSPLRESTQKDFQALLSPEAKISQVWGLTEVGWATASFWPDGNDAGSVGRPIPGLNVRLLDEQRNTIEEDNKQGEMYLNGPAMMLGYLDNPAATAEMIGEDGWLRTGDIGYRDQGKYYVIDRKKDLIKVRGWQVAPAEIEAVLLTHPQIIGAAVLGVPDTRETGELPRAFVIKKPKIYNAAATSYGMGGEEDQNEVTEEEVKSFVAERLARYKYLDGGVQFVKEIPRNASGKVLKPKLRALVTAVEADHEISDRTVTDVLSGPVDATLGEGVSGVLNGTITEISGRILNGDGARPAKACEMEIAAHVSGDFKGTYNVPLQEVSKGNTHQWNETDNERATVTTTNKTNGYTEKILGDAIESMKQNMRDNDGMKTSNGIKGQTKVVVGEKRKRTGMLTRRGKRQSFDMTAR